MKSAGEQPQIRQRGKGQGEDEDEDEDELRGYPGDDKLHMLEEAPMGFLLRRRCVAM